MCLPHFSISFSLLTIDHKISTNRAELLLVFFVFEVDAISFREQKQMTVCTCLTVNMYFDLLSPSRTRTWNSRPITQPVLLAVHP